jgi:hypothetical protein
MVKLKRCSSRLHGEENLGVTSALCPWQRVGLSLRRLRCRCLTLCFCVRQVNEGALRRAWESSQRSTREDWAEWMRHFSVELLKESPSPALRTCAGLAQLQPHVARELFAAGFVSCWSELSTVSHTVRIDRKDARTRVVVKDGGWFITLESCLAIMSYVSPR